MENKNNRPTGRKRNVTGKADPIKKKEQGLGTGPVGTGRPGGLPNQPHPGGIPNQPQQPGRAAQPRRTEPIHETRPTSTGRYVKRGGGALSLLVIAALILFGGPNLFGGGGNDYDSYQATPAPTAYVYNTPMPTATPKPQSTPSSQGSQSSQSPSSNNYGINPSSFNASSSTVNQTTNTNTASVDTTVAQGSREKRTVIRGDGTDQVTLMIYMCGTDLESRSSMATKDLVEMTKARFSDNVHVLVYTGGCTRWNNSVVSSNKNQIYEVKSGGLDRLESDMGSKPMTDPDTLTEFIKWCAKIIPPTATS